MNSARAAGGRLPKLDLIHSLVSCTKDAGHNANLTIEVISRTLSDVMTIAASIQGVHCGDNLWARLHDMSNLLQQGIYGWNMRCGLIQSCAKTSWTSTARSVVDFRLQDT